MSYLDVPRLHFTGTFTANPSTINNDPANYNPNLVEGPSSNPENIDVDGASVYMNPGDETSVNVWATSFGSPAQVPVALELVPSPSPPPSQFDNNQPPAALSFPASVTTGANGSASVSLSASNPSPLPLLRGNLGGQLYYIGGAWAAGNVWNAYGAGTFYAAPLSVKLFNSIEPPIPNPTWKNVQPILYKYYYLYAVMVGYVDLSNYDSVVMSKDGIQQVLNLDFNDPNYMPVTREMSNDERQLILTWIANGCPQGNHETKSKGEAFVADSPDSPDTGSAGAGFERPWSGG